MVNDAKIRFKTPTSSLDSAPPVKSQQMVMTGMGVGFGAFLVTVRPVRPMVVRVAPQEPQHGDNGATGEHEQHFGPLVLSFVELGHDDLTAGDVDEGTARETQECNVDHFVAFGDLHPDYDPQRRNKRKNSKEEQDLLKREASPGKRRTERDSSGRFVDYNAYCKLECLFDGGLEAECDAFKEGVNADGENEDNGGRLADSLPHLFRLIGFGFVWANFVAIDDLLVVRLRLLWQSACADRILLHSIVLVHHIQLDAVLPIRII